MIYKNTLIGLFLFLSAGFAIWTSLIFYHPQTNSFVQSFSLPDAFMEDVIAITMDKDGKPKMKIETPKMIHYAENDETQLTSPHVALYRNTPKPWVVTSKYAKATKGIENVDFWDDVVVYHPADLNNPETIIKTSLLTVHPNKQTAETKSPIIFLQPNTIVKAVGMFADMNTGDIHLLSQTRGEYVPTPQKNN